MQKVHYLILGTGVAGSFAADKLVKLGEGPIMMVSKEVERPYDRPPLSKEYFKGEMPEEKVYFHPADYYPKNQIELKLETEIVKIDPQNKKVVLAPTSPRLRGAQEEIGFEKLLIALGSKARGLGLKDPPAGRAGKPQNLHHLRRFSEARKLKKEAFQAKNVVILGAGFIGLELAAALSEKGIKVDVINRGPYLWDRFVNRSLAEIFEKFFKEHGVTFHYNDELDHFVYPDSPRAKSREGSRREGDPIKAVMTKKGLKLPTDLVIYAIGIILHNEKMLREAGFEFEDGLVVNEQMKTNFPDIYAAGDIINYPDPVFKERRRVEHWGHAHYSGELAAENMVSTPQKPYDLLTYVWSDLYDLHLEFAGLEQGYDQIKILGAPEKKKFTALYLKNKVLRAYFQINGEEKERKDLEDKIRKGEMV